jgi:hypothetical protein
VIKHAGHRIDNVSAHAYYLFWQHCFLIGNCNQFSEWEFAEPIVAARASNEAALQDEGLIASAAVRPP